MQERNHCNCSNASLLDVIRPSERTASDIAKQKQKRQERIGKQLARKRLLQQATGTATGSRSDHNNTAIYQRPGAGDLYLTGDSTQYSTCAFLNDHDVILAASLMGDVDVLKLPRCSLSYNYESSISDKNNTSSSITAQQLAGRLRLSSGESYSVTSKYKLKSFQNGHAFAIGSPSGSFSIFATEHGSTWCKNHALPLHCQQKVRQETPGCGHQQTASPEWMPFITYGWETDSLQRSRQQQSILAEPIMNEEQESLIMLDEPKHWSIKPAGDALWDFWEMHSSLMAIHAPRNYSGWSYLVGVMDSRTPYVVQSFDMRYKKKHSKNQSEGITATCFVSGTAIVTAHARPNFETKNKQIDNTLQVWDLRNTSKALAEVSIENISVISSSYISYLTPSNIPGQVMITSSTIPQRQESSLRVQHFWFDLGRQTSAFEASSYIHQYGSHHNGSSASLFATNPAQDFMVCHESSLSGNKDIVRLYDLQRNGSGKLLSASNAATQITLPVKRKKGVEENNNSLSKVSRRHQVELDDDTSTTTDSSNSSSDEDSDDGDNEPEERRPGIACTGRFRPKLLDQHGLSTRLSCLAVNDTGTAIIGGSYDGDIYAWKDC